MGFMKRGYRLLAFSIIAAVTLTAAQAAEPGQIIANSQDWRDVYSVMLYGSIEKKSAGFLVSERHSILFLNGVAKGNHILVFSSQKNPYVKGYKELIEGRGYTAEEYEYSNINLELANLSRADSFIITDDAYGYNAISVAPYAAATRTFVLFAKKENIREVTDFLQKKAPKKLILYGHVDKEVLNALKPYSPETINRDGDRFANNVEIIKKYQKEKGSSQAIFTNGEFIEKEIMSGESPVIFIGKNNVPDITSEYIKESGIKIGVLIGNDLVGTATTLRRGLGISVFVKFAQSARSPGSMISQVEGLDFFYLPTYSLDLSIQSIKYNSATNQLEVTIRNNVQQATYFKGTYTATAQGTTQTVGDIEPVFIEGTTTKTVVYSVGPYTTDEISARIYVIYGESKNALEKTIDTTFCPTCDKAIQTVSVIDECTVTIDEVAYSTFKNAFLVTLTNPSEVDCYTDVELKEVLVSGEKKDFAPSKIARLNPQETKRISIAAELDELDLEDNEIVKARAYFGQREGALIKYIDGEFELKASSIADAFANNLSYALMAIIALLTAGITWTIIRKRQQR
ncbi:hypothetical protein HY640_03325 [Candidatus Woesearchaeota archaeon]|nr:hypothetical protein [Candidatus Woesearchaeota archaeon]